MPIASLDNAGNSLLPDVFRLLDNAMLFNGMVAILLEPASGKIHYISPNVSRWGHAGDDFRNIRDIFAIADGGDLDEARRKRILTPGESLWFDFRIRLSSGEIRSLHARLEPCRENDSLLSFLYLVDTTQVDVFEGQPPLTGLLSVAALEHMNQSLSRQTSMVSYITDPDGGLLTQRAGVNRLYEIVLTSDRGRELCAISDGNLLIAAHGRRGVSYSFCECTGLAVACAPITAGETHLGYWFLGQLRTKNLTAGNIKALSERLGIDPDESLRAFLSLHEYEGDDVHHMSQTLSAAALLLSGEAQRNCLLRSGAGKRDGWAGH